MDLEEICLWKIVADNDKEKKLNRIDYIIFSDDSPCLYCSGKEYDCKKGIGYYNAILRGTQ